MRRPANGQWRSSGQPGRRQRLIDYPRIDQGDRLAFNARTVQRNAGRLSNHAEWLRLRTARLRLIEARAQRLLRQAEDGLRQVQRQSQLPHRQRLPGDLLARDYALFQIKRGHALRRSELARLLLGRAEGLLATLGLTEERVLQRRQTLLARSLGRTPMFERPRQSGGRGERWTGQATAD